VLLPRVPFVLLDDLEPAGRLGLVLAVSGLLEQPIELQLVLVGDLGVAGFGFVAGMVRVGGSSLMYFRACSKVACII
jgi:hypothetical protein